MRIRYLWLTLPAAAAVGAAAYFLKKSSGTAPAAKAAATPVAKKAPDAPTSVKEASYDFISGFKDAATVELKFAYDAEKFHFSVVEDDFLTESGDSHVGVLYGESFSAQVEYGSYYSGEDFAKLCQELVGKHHDLAEAVYGPLSGVSYRDGDNLCLAFPIPEDEHSYLLITLVKAPDNDDELEALLDYPELRFLLESASFSRS